MTVFTRTWNPAYEALPPDTENAKNGAERINETKVDVRERLEVDHSQAGDVDDGLHKKVTFVDPLGAKPAQVNDETYLYSKDDAGTSELFFEDEVGNEIQLTFAGGRYPIGAIYESTVSTNPGTLFGGTWTSLQGKVLMSEDGTTGYIAGNTGGSKNAIVGNHTHAWSDTSSSAGAHTHTVGFDTSGDGGGLNNISGGVNRFANDSTEITSAAANHTHSVSGTTSDASGAASVTNANMPPYIAVYMWERTA